MSITGLSPGSEELLSKTLTDSLTGAVAESITLHHGDTVYTTVSCTNSLTLTQEATSQGHLVVSKPPTSDSAYVVFHPQSHTVFASRDGTQASRDTVEFEFHGFEDITGMQVYNINLYLNIS